MATRYDLNWEPTPRRWRFMKDGVMHKRSVRQLKKDGYLAPDSPETKEFSYQGARAWQQDVLQKLHAAAMPAYHLTALARLKAMPETQEVREAIRFVEDDAACGDPLAASLLESFLPKATATAPAPPKTFTVGQAAETWLESAVRSRERLGQIVHREVVNHEYGVRIFRKWIGEDTPLSEIDEARWLEFFAHLSKLVHDRKYSEGGAIVPTVHAAAECPATASD